jgi:hypothetical protein
MPVPLLSTSTVYPALYLYPLHDSFFIPKQIALSTPGRRVLLGRKTSKSSPRDRQVHFDSSVVSRRHAEVWQEGDKVPQFLHYECVSIFFFFILVRFHYSV